MLLSNHHVSFVANGGRKGEEVMESTTLARHCDGKTTPIYTRPSHITFLSLVSFYDISLQNQVSIHTSR